MSDDFEDRIARLLRDNVDSVAGERRAAPPLRAPQHGTGGPGRWRRRGPWVAPLLAAACVAIVVGGTAGAVSLLSDKTPVTTQAPSPTTPPDTVTPAPTTHTPTNTPSTSGSTSGSTGHTRGGPAPNSPGHSGGTSSSSPPATQQVVVRPVHADGTIVAGYHTTTESEGSSFLCPEQSDVAVDPGIDFCGYGASNTIACWAAATPGYVLCLRDPQSKELIRIRYSGQFKRSAVPATVRPQAIGLSDGTECELPTGGGFVRISADPSWDHYYECNGGGDTYGPSTGGHGDGIDRSDPSWTVHYVRTLNSTPRTRNVVTAYYAGTAQ